jgi:hypothetical protein
MCIAQDGYGTGQRIEQTSDGVFRVTLGSLYTALGGSSRAVSSPSPRATVLPTFQSANAATHQRRPAKHT